MIVRDALPAELPRIGALRLAAYQAGDFLSDESNYGETLRTLGFDGSGQILAAVSGRRRPARHGDAAVLAARRACGAQPG